MAEEQIVSIIIPVYNVERVLKRCLDSIRTQTYKNIEVLLIDDGSIDKSGSICDSYVKQDNRFKVYHIVNSGVSNARNFGLDRFKGEYVTFIDSDDIVSPYLIEKLLSALIENKVTLATCHSLDYIDGEEIHIENINKYTKTVMNLNEYRFTSKTAHFVSWGVLYHRSIVEGLRFSLDLYVGEDTFFYAQALKRASRVVDIDIPLYYYILYENSLCHGNFNSRRYTEIISWERICELFKDYDKLCESCKTTLALRCFVKILEIWKNGNLEDKLYQDMVTTLKINQKYCGIRHLHDIKLSCKVKILSIASSLYYKLYKHKHKEMKKKSACVITIYDPNPNYGNRLQNYAVEQTIKKLGFNVKTLAFEKSCLDWKFQIKYIIARLTNYHWSNKKVFGKYNMYKLKAFRHFNTKFLNPIHIMNLKKITKIKTNFFVVGSDQVWNPHFFKWGPLRKDLFLLTFADSRQKICFSPSFGIESLPYEWREYFKSNLSTIPHISVREETGTKIIKELTGQDATVLIDPTMMLTVDEWRKIAKKSKNVDYNKPYIFTYFLGNRSEQIQSDIKKYAREYGFKVYNLMDYTQPEIFASGPSEFIYFIEHASLVFTDSFHACVFSFLFNKPFLVYNRQSSDMANMMSRIETLLSKFHLERKYVNSGLTNDIMECNYAEGFRQLEIERKKVIEFLKMSMEIK